MKKEPVAPAKKTENAAKKVKNMFEDSDEDEDPLFSKKGAKKNLGASKLLSESKTKDKKKTLK